MYTSDVILIKLSNKIKYNNTHCNRKSNNDFNKITKLFLSRFKTTFVNLQLRQEKCRLEQTLEQEQECLVNKLMRKIEKLEAETLAKQTNLERLRREKVWGP